MNNRALDHNASNQLNWPLTALAKTKTFMWVQSKVRRKIKHIQLWKLGKATRHGAAGRVFLLFYCFRIASQSRLRNKRKWKYWRIFYTSASLLLWKIVLLWWFVFSDTEGTGEIGNSKSSFNHFMTSAYFKNCKIIREWCFFCPSMYKLFIHWIRNFKHQTIKEALFGVLLQMAF